jgi:hypothetical protein
MGMIQLWCLPSSASGSREDGVELASQNYVKIRIVRQPPMLESGSLQPYRVGQVYYLALHVARYLIGQGYAVIERRISIREDAR